MKLADKPCYPAKVSTHYPGITIRERLIIALASNPEMMVNDDRDAMEFEQVASGIILQADAIIKMVNDDKEMESI